MDVSVVITCWNGKKLLEKNLDSVIKAANNPKNNIVEIIVVDDASTDDSAEYINKFKIQSSKFKVRLIKHERNRGYSATCNTGVKEANGELVAILNADVAPEINFLEAALSHFKDKKVFAVSFNEGIFGPGKIIWENGLLGIGKTELPQKTVLTGWANGGSAVFKKDIWKKLGGMDELFLPFYFEDIDLGIRASKAGYKCLFEPMAKVKHEHEATINADNFPVKYISRIKERNRLLLTWKNIDSFSLFLSHAAFLARSFLSRPGYCRIICKAIHRIGIIPLFFPGEKGMEELLSTEGVLKRNETIS